MIAILRCDSLSILDMCRSTETYTRLGPALVGGVGEPAAKGTFRQHRLVPKAQGYNET